ncbi:hypothetical protein [Rhodohalobacter sulfatireducens]|nr:hypothetical protein [Rhodohalobacter sulfatireducens]
MSNVRASGGSVRGSQPPKPAPMDLEELRRRSRIGLPGVFGVWKR